MKEIEQAFSKILLYFPSLAPVIFGWSVKENSEIETMATDYKNLYYNPEFVKSLSPQELRGVVLHEIFHNVFLHPTEITKIQSVGKDQTLWTIALEIVVNATVMALIESYGDFKLPGKPFSPLEDNSKKMLSPNEQFYYYDARGKEMTSEEIYRLLEQKVPPQERKTCVIASEGSSQRSPLTGDILPDRDKTDILQATEKAIAVLEKILKTKGNLPGNLTRLLKKLATAKAPWQRILHNFVATIASGMDELSWSRIDMKRSDEIVLPGQVSHQLEDIVVVVDTSGSISDKELRQFASEIAKLILYTDEVTVITTDTQVNEKVKIRDVVGLLTKVKFKGGGGTDFKDVFKTVERCEAMIFFTDGEATYPDKAPTYPVLWILTEDVKPPFGKVAYMMEV